MQCSLKSYPFDEVVGKLLDRIRSHYEFPHFVCLTPRTRNDKHHVLLDPHFRKKLRRLAHHEVPAEERADLDELSEDADLLNSDFIPFYTISTEEHELQDETEVSSRRYYSQHVGTEENSDIEEGNHKNAAESSANALQAKDNNNSTLQESELEYRPPHDISTWLNMVLQLTKGETDDLDNGTRHEALRLLAIALPLPGTSNRFSFALWKLYLIIYNARHDQDTGEIMSVCEDAVTCNPTQLFLWEMYINYAQSATEKLALCDRAINALCIPTIGTLSPDERSYAVLYLVLLRVRIECTSGYYDRAVDYLLLFLQAHPAHKEAYECITPYHMSLGLLHYIHLRAFGALPPLVTLPKYSAHNSEFVYLLDWKKLQIPMRAQLVETLRHGFELVDNFGGTAETRVAVYLNYIKMEMVLGNYEDACFLCQHYLLKVPQSDNLLAAYAYVLELSGSVSDAQLTFVKWLEKKTETSNFMVWHEFVCFTLRQEGKLPLTANAEALSILTKSVQMPFEATPALLSKYSKLDFVQHTRSLFKFLLRLDHPPVTHQTEFLKVQNYSTSMYLWLNYALFETLVGSENGTVEDVFRLALQFVKSAEARKKIWLEYLEWAKNAASEDEIQRIVDEGLADISSDIQVPLSTHEPNYTINNPSYLHLVTPFPLKDFSFHSELVEQFLDYIPRTRWTLVLERAVARFKNQNLVLAMRAFSCETSQTQRHFHGPSNHAIAYLSAAVLNPPFGDATEDCWLMLVSAVAQTGNTAVTREVLRQAVESFPISAKLWARYLALEEKEGDTEKINQILQQISEKGICITPHRE